MNINMMDILDAYICDILERNSLSGYTTQPRGIPSINNSASPRGLTTFYNSLLRIVVYLISHVHALVLHEREP